MIQLYYLTLTLAFASSVICSCSTEEDCSLNGVCASKECDCDPGWLGDDCGVLDLRPVTKYSGYNETGIPPEADFYSTTNGAGNSSWGGQIVHDPVNPKLFHLIAAQFAHGCGLSGWKPFSEVIRAVSTTGPAGPYKYTELVIPTWSHNPAVVYSPADKLFLLYIIGTPITPGATCKFVAEADNISVYTSPDLYEWKHYAQVLVGQTNPAPFPLYSTSNPTSEILLGTGAIEIFTAPDYAGAYTKIKPAPLFPNPNEDPFLWRDKRGNFHLLMHDTQEIVLNDTKGPLVGSHAFAKAYQGPWTFNSNTHAYNTTVSFTDGDSIVYYRRERPKLFFSEDGLMTPLYLSNGVQEKGKKSSYTLISPIGNGAAAYEAKMGFS